MEYTPETGTFVWLRRGKFHKRLEGRPVGSVYPDGYIVTKLGDKRYGLHRLAVLYMTGILPKCVDHINHVRGDNRWVNLRTATPTDNQRNKGKQKNNTSGVTGVSWHKDNKRWEAQIYLDNEKKYLGQFVKFSDAVDARKNAEVLYGFHENHGKDL